MSCRPPDESTAPRLDLRPRTAWYLLALFLLNFANPYSALFTIPFDYHLKDRLHLGATGIAEIHAWLALPGYIAFVFGYLRDRVSPFGGGDRTIILLAVPFVVAGFALLAIGGSEVGHFITGLVAIRVAWGLVAAAVNGTLVSFGQRYGVTDRISALSNGVGNVLAAVAASLAGWLVVRASMSAVFLGLAGANVLFILLVLRPPRDVFLPRRGGAIAVGNPAHAVAELVRHRPFLVMLGLAFLWNVSFVSGSPTFIFLTETVRLTPEQFGLMVTVQGFALAPAALVYGLFARRWPIRRILLLSVLLGILQPLAYFLIRDFPGAIAAAALFGLTLSLWNVAAFDLSLRVLPPRLAGTGLAIIAMAFLLSGTLSELAGSALYERGGFWLGVWLTPPVTMLMLPLLRCLPPEIDTARTD